MRRERSSVGVVLQMEWQPTFWDPKYMHLFGRVPEFTLYRDGRVIYLDDQRTVMEVVLEPDEVVSTLQQVQNLGLAKLRSYTSGCMEIGNGITTCTSDASFSVIRYRTDDGKLKSVRNYADYATDPDVLQALRGFFSDYRRDDSIQFHLTAASLFIRVVEAPPPKETSAPILDKWPLRKELLDRPSPDTREWGVGITGAELDALLQAAARNHGRIYVHLDGTTIIVEIVPWLPNEDYGSEIADYREPG